VSAAKSWHNEIASGSRFEFGANWAAFLKELTPERIEAAEQALRTMIGFERLDGKSFLDIGSGSGLFSLAAHRLGARVVSFDFDPQSVACTAELKRRYGADDGNWTVSQASILERGLADRLGSFDVVYSWGVLHHTGRLWEALENAARMVSPGGLLFIAIYNDQGRASRVWAKVKQLYIKAPGALKWAVLLPSFVRLWGPSLVRDAAKGRPLRTWRSYAERGMDPWRDVVDWVGGYPFEVARPEEVFEFCRRRGFELRKLKTCGGGHGCNEFVFVRAETSRDGRSARSVVGFPPDALAGHRGRGAATGGVGGGTQRTWAPG
jgi:2-polyprenyl-6-hydroxyphenyl methylase/3-demethylubiquinone-9 3-methyltransferase